MSETHDRQAWAGFMKGHGQCSESAHSDAAQSLGRLLAAAQTNWPNLDVDPVHFGAFVGQRLADADATAERIEKLHAADLYLACACAAGHHVACEAFIRTYQGHVRAAVSRILDTDTERQLVVRQVCDELLVARDTKPAKISRYKGRGSLLAFVGVVATNTALNASKKRAPEVAVDDFNHLADLNPSPELAMLRERATEEFRISLETALSNLSDDKRLLIKLQTVEGMTVRQAARVYGRSPATTGRHLAQARASLTCAIMADLRTRLDLTPSAAESLTRMVRRSVDLSVERLLAGTPQKSPNT